MSFLSLIARNLVRQRTRTLLTVLGIGIGITTVVALGSITQGMKAMSEEVLRSGGADFMVAQKGAADLSFSAVSVREWRAVEGEPGVARAWGVLMHYSRVGSNPFFITFGLRVADMPAVVPRLEQGSLPRNAHELALGARAASALRLGIGDSITVDRTAFRITGLYKSDSLIEDGGAYAPLSAVQPLARRPDVVTVVYVKVTPGTDREALAARIEQRLPQLAAISTLADFNKVDQGLRILDAGNLAISLLAVVIGAIGVMNTMTMSVFERTREIGILRAIGWRGRRIMRLIVGESLVLCTIAAVLGMGLGVAATRAVTLIPAVSSFLEPQYPVDLFVRALLIAVGVGLAGALYPAYRAVRLSPMGALRYE